MARDATARLYDVDADLVELDKKEGTIKFRAKKGGLVDLDKLHESIWATRLGTSTGMNLRWLEVTAEGQAVLEKNGEVRFKASGTDDYFVLSVSAEAKESEDAMKRLRAALEKGEKVVSVTGRVDGWTGNFTKFLAKLPNKPRTIIVKEFQTAKR